MKNLYNKSTKNYYFSLIEYDSKQNHHSKLRLYFFDTPTFEVGWKNKQYSLAVIKKT